PPAALDDLGDAVDLDHALLELAGLLHVDGHLAFTFHVDRGLWPRKASQARTQGALVAGGYERDRGRRMAQLCSAPEAARHVGGGRAQKFSPPSRAPSASALTR